MVLRSRLTYATLVLSAALAPSLLGIVSASASVKAGGRVVSASLTKTSFPAAQAKTVKLVYRLSPASKRFALLLSLKKGTKWANVRSVAKTGSFKGSYKMTAKALFGSKLVKPGQYRAKLSADANSLTRKFTVTKPTHTPTTPDTLRPEAGFWLGSGSDGVISYVIGFTVTSGGTNVTKFQVTFDDPECNVYGGNVTATSLYAVTSGSFSSGRGNPNFSGSFDSATAARGTSSVNYSTGDENCGDMDYEPAEWTATWHSAS